MNNDEAIRIRRYFEASLAEMAKRCESTHRDFRLGFKYALRLMQEIKSSTDELPLDILEGMAKAIAADVRRLDEPPPPEPPDVIPPPDSLQDGML